MYFKTNTNLTSSKPSTTQCESFHENVHANEIKKHSKIA